MSTLEIRQARGRQLLFADVTDFPNAGAGPPTTAANDIRIASPTPTKVQLDLTGRDTTESRQSAKVDLGQFPPASWLLSACLEFTANPTAAGTVVFYWAASPNPTPATGNPGFATGADADFTSGNKTLLTEIGTMTVVANVINIDTNIGILTARHRYGSLIVLNSTDAAFAGAGIMDETHITLTPISSHTQLI